VPERPKATVPGAESDSPLWARAHQRVERLA